MAKTWYMSGQSSPLQVRVPKDNNLLRVLRAARSSKSSQSRKGSMMYSISYFRGTWSVFVRSVSLIFPLWVQLLNTDILYYSLYIDYCGTQAMTSTPLEFSMDSGGGSARTFTPPDGCESSFSKVVLCLVHRVM